MRQRVTSTARLLQRIAFEHRQRGRVGQELVTQTFQIQGNRRVEGIIKTLTALPELRQNFGNFDTNLMLFNVQNGTIDLRTGKLKDHDPRDLITRISPVNHDPQAESPRWHEFLQQIFCGDQDLINYVQRVVGYSLTGVVSEKALFILYGFGHNGKSVFLETLYKLLGSYVGTIDPGDLIRQRNDRHPAGLASLSGKRIAYAQETTEGSRINEQLVKALTGGDTIPVRLMHQNPWEMKPTFTLFMSTNSKPVVTEQGITIWDRLKPIPFRYTVPPEQRIPAHELIHRFVEEEGAGVLRWAVEGCIEYLRDGRLVEPAVIRKEVDEYRRSMDTLGQFLEQECILTNGIKVPKSSLYNAYTGWCEDNAYLPLKADILWRKLRERGHVEASMRHHGAKVRCWLGIGLLSELGGNKHSRDENPGNSDGVYRDPAPEHPKFAA